MNIKKNPVTGKPYRYHWAVYAAREHVRVAALEADPATTLLIPALTSSGEFITEIGDL